MKAAPRLRRRPRRDERQLGDEPMRLAVEALGRMATLAQQLGAKRIEAVATSAVRDATNGAGLPAAACAHETGLRVRVLVGEEEARLAFRSRARALRARPRARRRDGHRRRIARVRAVRRRARRAARVAPVRRAPAHRAVPSRRAPGEGRAASCASSFARTSAGRSRCATGAAPRSSDRAARSRTSRASSWRGRACAPRARCTAPACRGSRSSTSCRCCR